MAVLYKAVNSGIDDLERKGVGSMAPPLVGATISMFFGTLGLLVIGGRGVKASLVENRKAVVFWWHRGLP